MKVEDGVPDHSPEHSRSATRQNIQTPVARQDKWGLALLTLLAITCLSLVFTTRVMAQSAPHARPIHTTNAWLDLLLVFILILINSLFVMAETAMLTVRRTRIEQLVEEGNSSAVVVSRLLAEPTRMLATLQVGLTLVQLFAAGAAAEQVVGPFSVFLQHMFQYVPIIAENARAIAFILIIMGVAFFTLVIGEITPKSLAIRNAESIALFSATPIRALQIIARPLVSVVTFFSRLLVSSFGGTPAFHTNAMTEEELKMMVEQSEEHGVIESDEKDMIHSIFDFADTVVRKVMTPRLDIFAVEADAGINDLLLIVTESGHSRLPVYDDDLDNIIGIVHVKDVLRAVTGHSTEQTSIRDLMRPPYFIPENKRVDDLLGELRRSRMQLAIVRDEYGALSGLVSIEDLLEEIVGDIQDEYDKELTPTIKQIDANTCIVDGRMSLEDFNDRMGVELPMEESDTLGGFVFGLMGHQPAKEECANWGDLEFKVEATDGRSIQRVRVIHHVELTTNLPDITTDGDAT